jgi:hypothetical protein
MSMIHIWGAMALLFALILAPVITFLWSGWRVRRRDIVEGFMDAAIQSYFQTFHPQVPLEGDLQKQFDRYYKSQFGRSRFILPLLLFAGLVGLLLCWSAMSIPDLLQSGSVGSGEFPALAIVAVMGAYMWVFFDERRVLFNGSLALHE